MRFFLNYYDDAPRSAMWPRLLAEVRLEQTRREGLRPVRVEVARERERRGAAGGVAAADTDGGSEGGTVTMSHTCHAVGCKAVVAPRLFACPRHWRMVPKPLQDALYAAYRCGQERDKRPSREYLLAAFAAQFAVAVAEGRCSRADADRLLEKRRRSLCKAGA